MEKLPLSFYQHDDVLELSRLLLGKYLMTAFDGIQTGGMIVETEAYRGPEDRASHAFGNRKTKRNSVMYEEGGVCYVYICYGLHHLLNVVTHREGVPHAVLIRAIEPKVGIETMLKRRGKEKVIRSLTAGPGALAQALGITRNHNGISLTGDVIWIEDHGVAVPNKEIVASPRIGVAYAGEDASLPWRFRIKNNPWTSQTK
jgi:DNA-3-methyladenine glycosylase